mmetsp:Transcript_8213/g.19564  ORF Transcript_8213/g.19564 Transcript_8213/m.19564 type:complete len:216 (-) Transcript_8213:267-914(-)
MALGRSACQGPSACSSLMWRVVEGLALLKSSHASPQHLLRSPSSWHHGHRHRKPRQLGRLQIPGAHLSPVGCARVPENEIPGRSMQQNGPPISPAQQTKVTFAVPEGELPLQLCQSCRSMRARHHFQAAGRGGHRKEGHHPLNSFKAWLLEGILVQVQSLSHRPPGAVNPPGPPNNQGIHGNNQVRLVENLLEGVSHPRAAANEPGALILGHCCV